MTEWQKLNLIFILDGYDEINPLKFMKDFFLVEQNNLEKYNNFKIILTSRISHQEKFNTITDDQSKILKYYLAPFNEIKIS